MKKVFNVVVIVALIFATGCSHYSGYKALNEPKNDSVKKQHEVNEKDKNIERMTLPLSITNETIDLDGDGVNENVHVVMTQGEELEGNKYHGQFAIQLRDKDNNKIHEIVMNKQDAITLQKDFQIIFKDYTGDHVLDFNIGYANTEYDDEYYYRFYTLSKDNRLEELTFRGKRWLESRYLQHSFDFLSYENIFMSYYNNGDEYVYQHYRWDDSEFWLVNETKSPIDYQLEVDEALIASKINAIAEAINKDKIDEKHLLDIDEKSFNWLLDHYNEVDSYLFMQAFDDMQPIYDIERVISNKIDDLKRINSLFSYFGVEDIRKVSLDAFRQIKVPPVADNEEAHNLNCEEYDWEVDGNTYKLLVSSHRLSKFMVLFSESGKYLDSLIWSDKRGEALAVTYRNVQNAYSVAPICMGYGTGIAIYGEAWFEIYKDKLIKSFDNPINGHEAPPPTLGYNIVYKTVKDGYNDVTGDYHVTYHLGIGLDDDVAGVEKTVIYKWDDVNKVFENNHMDVNDLIYQVLFDDNIEDMIFKQNYQQIKAVIDNGEANQEDDIGDITMFLTKCSPGKERDQLLRLLKDWYKRHEDIYYSKELLQMINDIL